MLKTFLFRSVNGIALIALPAGVLAQDQAPGEQEAIIVNGEKIDRSLQETASSVAVTTDERIEAENIQTLQEVFNRTANVSETYGSTGFTIRGIANQAFRLRTTRRCRRSRSMARRCPTRLSAWVRPTFGTRRRSRSSADRNRHCRGSMRSPAPR